MSTVFSDNKYPSLPSLLSLSFVKKLEVSIDMSDWKMNISDSLLGKVTGD
jgi:hypothetical protein